MVAGYNDTLRDNQLDEVTADIDGGTGAGLIRIYTGPRPAKGAAITTETLLVTLTFSDPSAPAASSGVLTFSSITDGTAAATGTAAWARIVRSDSAFVMDMDVATSASDLNLISTSITSGQTVSITSATITAGNA